MQWRVFNRVFTLNFRWTFLEAPVLGIRSNLDEKSVENNGLHALLLDYDDILSDKELIKELYKFQKRFRLGDCEVFKSSWKKIYRFILNKNFPFLHIKISTIKKRHVYFFEDMMTYWQAIKIIFLSSCDPAFKRWRMIRNNIVLRISPKSDGCIPEPEFIVKSPYSKPEIRWFKDYVYGMLRGEEVIKNRSFSAERIWNG
jgi:hypothetical protein